MAGVSGSVAAIGFFRTVFDVRSEDWPVNERDIIEIACAEYGYRVDTITEADIHYVTEYLLESWIERKRWEADLHAVKLLTRLGEALGGKKSNEQMSIASLQALGFKVE